MGVNCIIHIIPAAPQTSQMSEKPEKGVRVCSRENASLLVYHCVPAPAGKLAGQPCCIGSRGSKSLLKNKWQCQNIPQHFSDVPFTKTSES